MAQVVIEATADIRKLTITIFRDYAYTADFALERSVGADSIAHNRCSNRALGGTQRRCYIQQAAAPNR